MPINPSLSDALMDVQPTGLKTSIRHVSHPPRGLRTGPPLYRRARRSLAGLTCPQAVWLRPVLLALMAAIISAPAAAEPRDQWPTAATITGTPDYIVDGDTFAFGKIRIRLKGINTPEIDEPYGPEATDFLRELIAGGLTCYHTGEKSYDRMIAWCVTPEGRDISEELVRAGLANDLPRYSNGQYADVEAEAKAEKRGLYSE